MKAVILAAGVGRRLAPLTEQIPKCLVEVGGEPLLTRMLAALSEVAVSEAVLVVGHLKEVIRERMGTMQTGLPLRYVENPHYKRGSLFSLWCAREEMDSPLLLMDADVLFAPPLLQRLVKNPAQSCLLLDETFTDTGEEMKGYALGWRVVAIGRKAPEPPWDLVGEGVGFFKCSARHARILRGIVEQLIRDGRDDEEYELALDRLVKEVVVEWCSVARLPWMEIDFPEDVRRAQDEIWPRLEAGRW